MITVIRIDPDDELPAILERLPAGAACVLVLPSHARALNSAVGAKLLLRRATVLSSRVAVVTSDHAVAAHARAAGVPVADTVEEAQRLLGADDAPAELAAAGSSGLIDGVRGAAATPRDGAPDDDQTERGAPSGRGDPDAAGRRGGAEAGRARRTRRGPAATVSGTPPGRGRVSGLSAQSGPWRFVVSSVIVALPLLLLGWLALNVLNGLLNPSATLTIRPRADLISAGTTVRAVFNLPLKKRGPYHLAMARLSQAEQATVGLPVRGTVMVPDRLAVGRVELVNMTSKPLLVPAGTTFTTALNRVSFVSTRDVTLPAATLTFTSAIYGAGWTPIRASIGGRSGNVPKGAIVNVPAAFTGIINVQNAEPTRGGTDKPERVVAPHDLQVATARLFGALMQKAAQDVTRRFGGDVEQTNLWVDSSPAVSKLAPDRRSATLALSIVAHMAYVHRHDLMPAVTAALQPVIAARPRETLIPGSLSWASTWTPVRPISVTAPWDPRTAITQTIALTVTGRMKAPLDVAGVLHAIGGQSRSAALAYLRGRGDVDYADITLSPPWVDHLPSDTTRIRVIPQEPR